MKDIFRKSENCWRLETAHRAAFLIDGEDYFKALHQSMRQARRSIMITGWDLHSGLCLLRGEKSGGYPSRLGKFLNYLARKTDGLQIYLLGWDFSMIYAMEREFFPRYRLKWISHKRIHFCLDSAHPVGASQHQKIVVVDDAVAFVGGFDLSKWRWDTSEHLPDNELRRDPDGISYPPFHDVQMIVDGPAARALGELSKTRWKRASGEAPLIDGTKEIDAPWPGSVKPDFEKVQVALARTLPQYRHYDEVREVERLYLDSIAAAQKFIYIENQYLSSFNIGKALESRLKDKDGPEIVIVMPKKTGGWLEQHTMDVLRGRILGRLHKVGSCKRLKIYYPRLAVNPEVDLMVHAKIMVIDDNFVRVGSSNLSNRSLGFDSECDLAITAEPGSPEAQAIASFRNRLLAEHLGVADDDIVQAMDENESLIKAVEALRGGERSLEPMDGSISPELDNLVPQSELLDPEKPIEPKELLDYFISPDQQLPAYRQVLKVIALIAVVLSLAAAWRWTSLSDWLEIDRVLSAAGWLKQQPFSPILVLGTYVLCGLVSFPVTLLIIATVIIFGPWWGMFYALSGAELSALAMFFLGRRLGRETVSRFAGSILNRLNNKLSESGLMAVITFRIIPVAPFSVINMIAGISSIRLQDYLLGTIVGMLPGTIAITIVADQISETLRHPDLGHLGVLFAAVVVFAAGMVWLRRWLRRGRSEEKADNEDSSK
ncbi:VTT domain-containing protein [Desulfopila inferna]|uniref:VTT domain-containing protein n=1 Tax=Desulfopila inferna TaxID=468528 RepID=UPI001963099E|nr:VTT domain-containing protein [Desulfopila inferna]MBM9603700.1 VTT domain-containing protein [Desulfopila inferna]